MWKNNPKFVLRVIDSFIWFILVMTLMLVYNFDKSSDMTATNLVEIILGLSVILGVKNLPWSVIQQTATKLVTKDK